MPFGTVLGGYIFVFKLEIYPQFEKMIFKKLWVDSNY